MSRAAYDQAIQAALDKLEEAVCQAEAAGLTVVVRQSEMSYGGEDSVVMNSFEVYQRLL